MGWLDFLGKAANLGQRIGDTVFGVDTSKMSPWEKVGYVATHGLTKKKSSAPSGTPYYLARSAPPRDFYQPPAPLFPPAKRRSSPMPFNVYGEEIPGYAPRRRRGRGITARDLRSFKRVANLIRKFSGSVRRFKGIRKGGR